MLTSKQLQEIREHSEKAQNPLFFFDNDVDGLCSFLLLARFAEKGKGVAIKSFPDLGQSYARKLYELKPDYVFVLDKPIISKDFLDEAKKLNLPFVWIDHHDTNQTSENIYLYNPTKSKEKSSEPVTYWAYKISKKEEDLWLAMIGCIGDNFLPEFVPDFEKKYPELWQENVKTAFQALYETDIGKITRILSFALKDRTSNVVRMLKFLLKLKNPQEILRDEPKNHILFRFKQVNRKYQKLIDKAKKFSRGKLIYFQYGGELSLSADIANELSYKFPGKVIVVAYVKGTKANISIRGKAVNELTIKAIKGLKDATGGGHENATGAKINAEDLPKFKENLERLVS
jgi:single-stranded DNA-specific DHH superfamily exonuclease